MVKPCYNDGGFPFLYKKLLIMNVNPKHDVIIFNNDTKLNDFLVLYEEKSSNRSCKVLQYEFR
jgi:hypothetical protein